MVLFQPPASTRFDLRFRLAGIPVRVHPLFWVMALIFGAASRDFLQIIIWVAVVFVSILIHEMGHALTMGFFGQSAEVVLYIGGGLAVPGSERYGRRRGVFLHSRQRIVIALAGPFAGFLFATVVLLVAIVLGGTISYVPLFGFIPSVSAYFANDGVFAYLANSVLGALLWVNIFWGFINLTPVQPLDGGNVAREYLTSTDPIQGERKSLWISVIAGAIVAAMGVLLMQSVYVTLLFAFLAYQSYEKVKGGSRRYY